MKKRILSLVMIMPFMVMLLAFGFSKTVNLFVDLAPEHLEWDYSEHEAFEFSASAWENGVELFASVYPENATNKQVEWKISDEQTFDGSPIDPENPIAHIENGKLYKDNEGIVTITASVKGTSLTKSFRAYLIEENEFSTDPKFVILLGKDTGEVSIKSSQYRYFGLYNHSEGQVEKSTEYFTAMVFPSNAPRDVEVVFEGGNSASATVSEPDEFGRCQIAVSLNADSGNQFLTLQVKAKDTEVSAYAMFKVVDGVNVYNYDDLMFCTDEEQPKVTVLRTNLESAENVKTRNNSALFGREVINGGKTTVECEYTEMQSTYEVRYYTNAPDYKPEQTLLKVGVTFRKSVYGNGYTINAHELTYPSETQADGEVAIPSLTDPYQGPLIFVQDLSVACYAQDNIGFLVLGDNITIDNITLKNCNNVSNLSNLDYVGTVVEVMGNNVTIQNSQLQNGRTVLRSMSNMNLKVNACVLSYAREFIFKLGSNKFVYPETGIDYKNRYGDNRTAKYKFLSPSTDENGEELEGNFDSTATVKNTYFHTSGVFCIAMDTHFAGDYLYNRSSRIRNMAATSYPSHLTLEGDVRFYDWKSVDGLDSSTLISAGVAEDGRDFSGIFNISQIIQSYYDRDMAAGGEGYVSDMILVKDGKKYVHGGIAYYGGGRNLSEVNFDGLKPENISAFRDVEEPLVIGLNDPAIGDMSVVLEQAAGYGPFTFYMYRPDYTNITVGSMPEVTDLNIYAVL